MTLCPTCKLAAALEGLEMADNTTFTGCRFENCRLIIAGAVCVHGCTFTTTVAQVPAEAVIEVHYK